MEISNLIVGLILSLQTPFFIVALVAGIWANMRINAGSLGRKTRLLAWASFVSCLLVTVGHLGRSALIVRFGGGLSSVAMALFMTLLWGFFSWQSYRVLRRIGAA